MPTSKDTQAVPGQGDPADENTVIVSRARRIAEDTGADRAERERQAAAVVRTVTSNGHSALAKKQVRDLFRESRILTAADFDRLARESVKITQGMSAGPHPVNVSDEGFTYSTGGAHASCARCASAARGLYQGDRFAGPAPVLHALPFHGEGSSRQSGYLLSKTPDSVRVNIPGEEIESGKWAFRLGMQRSADHRIRDALATVILYHLAAEAPEVPAFPSAELRDATGHLYIPVPECLPAGYTVRPKGTDDATAVEAGRRIAVIAGRNPKTALALGMSVDSPFVSVTSRQPSWVNLYGPKRMGKSTALFLNGSVWGKVAPPTPGPDQVVRSWDQTAKAPGRFLGQLGILPAFFDESGVAGFAPVEWARQVYGGTQGASRGQAESQGMGSRATPGWRGRLFMTGNDMIADGLEGGQFDGIPARLIQFAAPFATSAAECEELETLAAQWHGWLGPAVLAAYTPGEWGVLLAAAGELLDMPDGGLARTIGKDMAGGVAGAMAADHMLGTGTLIADAALIAAREYLDANRAEGLTGGRRMLSAIQSSMSLHRSGWASRKAYEDGAAVSFHDRELLGVYDDELLCVATATWKAIAEAEGLGPTMPLKELHRAGTLDVPPQTRKRGEWTGRAPRWAGQFDCYRLKLADVRAADDEDQGDEAPEAPPAPPVPGRPSCSACGEPMTVYTPGQTMHPMCEPEPPAETWPEGSAGASANPPAAPERPSAAPKAARVPAPAAVTPEATAAPTPTGAWLTATWTRKDNNGYYFKSPATKEALTRIVTLLDENPDKADKDAVRDLATRMQLLAELEGTGEKFGGPFLPKLRGANARLMPWKKSGLPVCAEMARVIEGYGITRDYHGPVVSCDRNGAWIGAIGTTLVALGGLDHTGECEPSASSTAPGYYLVNVYPWTETDTPSPLGNEKPGTQVWIPAPTMGLLAELAAAGRWPEATALDSWTGEPVRLAAWGRLIRETRRYALETYGYESGAYQAAKDSFSTAVSLMNGTIARDSAQPVRQWGKCKTQRIDWRHQIITNSAVFMWRAYDRCRMMADGNPALMPVGLRAKDELLIPAAALNLFSTRPYPGGTRPPVRIDNSGVELGTFKDKTREDW